ncbi:unnamed protein product, partial [Staurois parvus]
VSAKSGNPELHSGLPCSVAQGVPAALTLSFAPTMCPPFSVPGHLLRPMPASSFCVPVPVTSGRKGAGGGGKFEKIKKCNFFQNTFFICFVLCPACVLSVLS